MKITSDGRYKGIVSFNGKRHNRIFDTIREAYAWEQKTLDRLARGLPAEEASSSMTLGELLEYSSKNHWAGNKAELNSVANAADVAQIVGMNFQVSELSAVHFEKVREACKVRKLSNGTINRKLSALSCMARIACRLGILDRMPMVRKEREAEPRSRVLTDEEQAKLFSFLPLDYRHLCVFLVNTGMRVSEATSLRWEDIQSHKVQGKEMYLVTIRHTKTNRARSLPLNAAALDVLTASKTGATDSGPFQTLKSATLHIVWKRAKRDAKLDHSQIVPHCLRHTFATRLIQSGVSMLVAKELLGHSTIATTERYAHIDLSDKAKALGLIDSSWKREPS